MAGRTVAIQFVRAAMQAARLSSGSIDDVLREAGISPQLVGQDATRIAPAQATRLIRALWEATDDELLGMGPRPVPRGMFRMMTLGLIHAPDLRTALRRYTEFARITTGFVTIELVEHGDLAEVVADPGSRTVDGQLVLDILLGVAHRLAGWLIGEQIVLDSVTLPGPAPGYSAEYPLLYGVSPALGTNKAAMAFHSRYLTAPVIRSEQELFALIRNSPNGIFFRDDYNPSTSSRVRKIIERRSGDEIVTVDDVAERLCTSAQHLRRRLREEGTSFRAIKEEILRDEAIAGLTHGRETVEQLSDRLGFSEPSAFRRAFRRWTGSSPGSYRPLR